MQRVALNQFLQCVRHLSLKFQETTFHRLQVLHAYFCLHLQWNKYKIHCIKVDCHPQLKFLSVPSTDYNMFRPKHVVINTRYWHKFACSWRFILQQFIITTGYVQVQIIFYTLCKYGRARLCVCVRACASTCLWEWVVTRGEVIAKLPNSHLWGEVRVLIT